MKLRFEKEGRRENGRKKGKKRKGGRKEKKETEHLQAPERESKRIPPSLVLRNGYTSSRFRNQAVCF